MTKSELTKLIERLVRILANMEDSDKVCELCYTSVDWIDANGKRHVEPCYCDWGG